jgi:methyl-accepting chemotaxis protein
MHSKPYSLLERLFNGNAIKHHLAELEAELKVRKDIMNLTSIVSEADKKGGIISINGKFVAVSKYSSGELLGQPHSTTRHPDAPQETFKQMWAMIGRGEMFRGRHHERLPIPNAEAAASLRGAKHGNDDAPSR